MADDVLAVLDELGLERVKLVGHDWGGWIGFLLCLRAPQRFERYLALNILPPWTSAAGDGAAPLALLVPVADPQPGHRLPAAPQRQVRAESPGRRLDRAQRPGTRRRCAPSPTASPSRRGRGRRCRCTGSSTCARRRRSCAAATRTAAAARCRPGCSSAPTTRRSTRDCSPATSATPRTMELELVDGCGHFIADELPDLVAERAREFLARRQ